MEKQQKTQRVVALLRLLANSTERFAGPKPSKCNPNPATCAADSEALRSKVSLRGSPAVPLGAGETRFGGKDRPCELFRRSAQRVVALLLSVLVGTCFGMLLPCRDCATQPSVAAFSNASVVDMSAGPSAAPEPPEPTQINLFAVEPTKIDAPPTPAPSVATGFAIEVLGAKQEVPPKRVLIYHTHTYEAYEQAQHDPYQETEQWRTADERHNMVRVGEELAGLLRGLGMTVVHDRTAFEPPDLSGAYARSLAMLEQRISAGESYDLYIDLHRDAYTAGMAGANTVYAGGIEAARLMLLIGKGEGQTSQGFDVRPDWEQNLAIAQAITDSLNAQVSGLCKDVRLKSGRFNQHIDVGCVLVEVGNNRNTLAQALAAMPYLADAISEALAYE